jgi:hypothetical protein
MQAINSTMMKPVKTIFAISMLLTLFCTCRNAQIQNHTVVIKPYSDQIINTMQGGFGASMHAIEDSLPVSTDGGKYRSWGGSVWGGPPLLKIQFDGKPFTSMPTGWASTGAGWKLITGCTNPRKELSPSIIAKCVSFTDISIIVKAGMWMCISPKCGPM